MSPFEGFKVREYLKVLKSYVRAPTYEKDIIYSCLLCFLLPPSRIMKCGLVLKKREKKLWLGGYVCI